MSQRRRGKRDAVRAEMKWGSLDEAPVGSMRPTHPARTGCPLAARGVGAALCERCGDTDEFVRKAAPLAAELAKRGIAFRWRKGSTALRCGGAQPRVFQQGTRGEGFWGRRRNEPLPTLLRLAEAADRLPPPPPGRASMRPSPEERAHGVRHAARRPTHR